MIHVLATVQLQPGTRAAFLEEFRKLMPLVHAEDGCGEYGPAVDVASGLPAQPAVRDDVVVVIEKWRDLEALRAHLAAEHMAAYRQRVKDLVISVSLQVLAPGA